MPTPPDRLEFIEIQPTLQTSPLCAVTAEGLSAPRKWLPCRYFYDRAGSELFEQICDLPEYYLTRTERAILDRHASEILAAAGEDLDLVEFGSGSSVKTRLLLSAGLSRQESLHYIPIDISGEFLRTCADALLRDFAGLHVTAIAAEYHDAMAGLPATTRPRLILFLGSSVGNFTRQEAVAFLTHVRRSMRPCDRLLVGIDLIKRRSVLEAAYNDSSGITAAFNKNLLVRINRELGANIDVNAFDHFAPFVEEQGRIEMHLICRRSHAATIDALDLTFQFRQGETIHTENSHKYTLAGFTQLCREAGLTASRYWTDPQEWFGMLLLEPNAKPAQD